LVPLPEGARRVLRTLYPGLDLDAVSFHLGMPHLLVYMGGVAITLPALLARRRVRVYVKPRYWDPESVDGLGTLAHEAYHALQAQEAGWGWGPLRPFLVLYLACSAANGFRYRGHPMEEDAYRLAGYRRSRFESTFSAADCAAMEQGSAALAAASSDLRFWRKLAASTPLVKRFVAPEARRLWPLALLGFPPVALWLLVWGVAASILWIARLLVEAGGAAAAGLLWVGGLLLSSIARIFAPRHAGP